MSKSLSSWIAPPGQLSVLNRTEVQISGRDHCNFSGELFLEISVSRQAITPSTQSNLFPKLICFFYVETHKVSTSIRGGFHILLHKTFLEQVHSARLLCTADTRPLKEFEKDPNLAENRVEYVLMTTWDGNSIFFSAKRARPGSGKSISESGINLIVWRGLHAKYERTRVNN